MPYRKKLLLHTCCGPCSIYPLEVIRRDESLSPVLFFYNPNIHPEFEYKKRKKTMLDYAGKHDLPLLIYENKMMQESFMRREKIWRNYDEDTRCAFCYESRLSITARYAAENEFDAFTTTLLGSIYQDHDMLIKICLDLAGKNGIDFYYEDFRDGFRQGQQTAREEELYRQQYCGCIRSFDESPFKEKILGREGLL